MEHLSPKDMAEISLLSREIMTVIPATARHARLEHEITQVIAKHVLAVQKIYEDVLAAEEIHFPSSTDAPFAEHSIRNCKLEYCGRYAGQRREQALEDFSRYGCLPGWDENNPGVQQ